MSIKFVYSLQVKKLSLTY